MSNAAAELIYDILGTDKIKEISMKREMERIAIKMLLRGDSIEDIVEITELPYEAVACLVP